MSLLEEKDREFLREKFEKELEDEVKLILFTKRDNCEYCEIAVQLVDELSLISSKIKVSKYDYNKDRHLAESWNIDKVPAFLLFGKREYNVRFFGLPAGYEFTTLIEDIIDVSKGMTRLTPKTKGVLKTISSPVHIHVFVTPTCPYCTRVVTLAHQFAIENLNIVSDMIEAMEFPDLANKYNVLAVPKTVINDKVFFEGAIPEPVFLQNILKALEEKD
ncbi:MAG: thioredoxin family protein [Nitrososphaerota archaeon]